MIDAVARDVGFEKRYCEVPDCVRPAFQNFRGCLFHVARFEDDLHVASENE